jgi:hypothetical protein
VYHTPEPWLYDEERAAVAYDGRAYAIDGHRIGCIIAEPRLRTDGRRIAACVNACAGIEDPADLRKQRDELLDVLRTAIRRVEIANAEGDPILSAWLPTARAAIVNAEQTTDAAIQWGLATGGSASAKYGRKLTSSD